MIVIIGLIVLIAAVIVAVVGVLANGGHSHPMAGHFAAFGYHVTGSTGALFLYGIVVGAVGLLGLSLVLAGYRRTARRGSAARHELKQSQTPTAPARGPRVERDDLDDRDGGPRPARRELFRRRPAQQIPVGVSPGASTASSEMESPK